MSQGGSPAPLPYESPEFAAAWGAWIGYKKEIRQKMPDSTISSQFAKLAKWGELAAITSIENSISAGWRGLFEPQGGTTSQKPQSKPHRKNEYPQETLQLPD